LEDIISLRSNCGIQESTKRESSPPAGTLKIRKARRGDAESIARLSGELGYPASSAQIATRLRQLTPMSQHAVFVAESDEAGGLIGWVHISVSHLLESDTRAEVNGLIVSEGQRSAGAGAKLLKAAEEWARRHGCRAMNVRSNVIRERAHTFYERNGYEHYKTQKAFRKLLQSDL
jgi:GNAT superfamily N-acetyltransferase